jgi:hypothetical protein
VPCVHISASTSRLPAGAAVHSHFYLAAWATVAMHQLRHPRQSAISQVAPDIIITITIPIAAVVDPSMPTALLRPSVGAAMAPITDITTSGTDMRLPGQNQSGIAVRTPPSQGYRVNHQDGVDLSDQSEWTCGSHEDSSLSVVSRFCARGCPTIRQLIIAIMLCRLLFFVLVFFPSVSGAARAHVTPLSRPLVYVMFLGGFVPYGVR